MKDYTNILNLAKGAILTAEFCLDTHEIKFLLCTPEPKIYVLGNWYKLVKLPTINNVIETQLITLQLELIIDTL